MYLLKVLGDEKKRQQYDTFGSAGVGGNGGNGQPGGGFGGYQYKQEVDPEELFRTIFGDAFKGGASSEFESMFGGGHRQQTVQNEIIQVILLFLFFN